MQQVPWAGVQEQGEDLDFAIQDMVRRVLMDGMAEELEEVDSHGEVAEEEPGVAEEAGHGELWLVGINPIGVPILPRSGVGITKTCLIQMKKNKNIWKNNYPCCRMKWNRSEADWTNSL